MSGESTIYATLLTSLFKHFLSLILMNLILSNHMKILKYKGLKSYLKGRKGSIK